MTITHATPVISDNVQHANSARSEKPNGTLPPEKCDNNNVKPKSKAKLKEKVFIERQSLINELFDVKHIRNIQYIFMVFLLAMCVNHVADGLIHEGRFSLHITAIILNFADGHLVMLGWLLLFTATLLVYPVFQIWAHAHNQMSTTPLVRKSWDALWVAGVLAYYCKIFAFAGEYVTSNDLTFTSSFFLTIEATRLLMKTHAFIRGNITKVLRDQSAFQMPARWHYFEFLFMPTLVYRDSYPRTKSIDWRKVMIYALEICGCVIFICYLYNMYFAASCAHYKMAAAIPLSQFAWLIFSNTVPSLGIMILLFYFILHLWQNLFGELTHFADRQFYQDWWNATSYDEYYRKWNIVVHDWLYNYIYKDVHEALPSRSLLLPKFLVFLISAVVHEYVLYYTMRMFYPVLATIFLTFAMIFTSFRSPKYWLLHVLFLYGYAFGVSITLTSYVIEYCLRQNPCASQSPNVPFNWMYSKTFFSECSN